MSSLKAAPMFTQMPQPLRYAEALVQRFAALSQAASGDSLLSGLVDAAAALSGCELSQLYLLDDGHARLTLSAEWLNGSQHTRAVASLPSDYDGEQLLQFCLSQNRVLSISELDSGLHQSLFLPPTGTPWRSLLCLPLVNQQRQVSGLLITASTQAQELAGFADSLSSLGNFALSQLQLLERVHTPAPLALSSPASPSVCASGYGLIGDSPSMRDVYRLISKVLHNPVNIRSEAHV